MRAEEASAFQAPPFAPTATSSAATVVAKALDIVCVHVPHGVVYTSSTPPAGQVQARWWSFGTKSHCRFGKRALMCHGVDGSTGGSC